MYHIGEATLFLFLTSDGLIKATPVPSCRYSNPPVKSQLMLKLLFTFMLEFLYILLNLLISNSFGFSFTYSLQG